MDFREDRTIYIGRWQSTHCLLGLVPSQRIPWASFCGFQRELLYLVDLRWLELWCFWFRCTCFRRYLLSWARQERSLKSKIFRHLGFHGPTRIVVSAPKLADINWKGLCSKRERISLSFRKPAIPSIVTELESTPGCLIGRLRKPWVDSRVDSMMMLGALFPNRRSLSLLVACVLEYKCRIALNLYKRPVMCNSYTNSLV